MTGQEALRGMALALVKYRCAVGPAITAEDISSAVTDCAKLLNAPVYSVTALDQHKATASLFEALLSR